MLVVALVLLFRPNFVLLVMLVDDEDVVWCAINSAPRLTKCARRAELKLSPPPPPHVLLGLVLVPELRVVVDFDTRRGVALPDKWCSMFSCSTNSGWSSLWWLCMWWWCKLLVGIFCCWFINWLRWLCCWLLVIAAVEWLLTTKGVATSTCAVLLLIRSLMVFFLLWYFLSRTENIPTKQVNRIEWEGQANDLFIRDSQLKYNKKGMIALIFSKRNKFNTKKGWITSFFFVYAFLFCTANIYNNNNYRHENFLFLCS